MQDIFHQSWARAWRGIGGQGSGTPIRDQILRGYAEAHRKYHTLQHLEECLRAFEHWQHFAEHGAEVELALWFHDAIYDTHRDDNEERCAECAAEALLDAGAAEDVAHRVVSLVLITRHTAQPTTPDEKLLVDIDLSILAASPARFAEYQRQIREEYGWVPDEVFVTKRTEVLQRFLQREPLFLTDALRDVLGAWAKRNLAAAIEHLANPPSDQAGVLPRRMREIDARARGYVLAGIFDADEASVASLWKLNAVLCQGEAVADRRGVYKWAVYADPAAVDNAFWVDLQDAIAGLAKRPKRPPCGNLN